MSVLIIGLTTSSGNSGDAEQLEQVAQLLALLAQLVVGLGGARRRRSRRPSSASAGRPCGSARRRPRRSAAPRPDARPPASPRARRGTNPSPRRSVDGPSGAQRPDHLPAGRQRAVRAARAAADRGQPCIASGTSTRVESNSSTYTSRSRDVAGGLLQPAELRPEARELVGREYALELALDERERRTATRKVVQELGVDVGDRAVEVRLDHLEQPAQHDRGSGVRALTGLERNPNLRRETAGHAAGGPDRLIDQRLVGGLEAELDDEHLLHAAQLLVVPADAGHPQARPQRRVRAVRSDELRLLEREPDDRLALVVEHGQQALVALETHEREHRANVDDRSQRVAQRAGRQLDRRAAAWSAPASGAMRPPSRRRATSPTASRRRASPSARRPAATRRTCRSRSARARSSRRPRSGGAPQGPRPPPRRVISSGSSNSVPLTAPAPPAARRASSISPSVTISGGSSRIVAGPVALTTSRCSSRARRASSGASIAGRRRSPASAPARAPPPTYGSVASPAASRCPSGTHAREQRRIRADLERDERRGDTTGPPANVEPWSPGWKRVAQPWPGDQRADRQPTAERLGARERVGHDAVCS